MAFYDQEQDEDSQSNNAPAATQVSSGSSVITGAGGSGAVAGQGGAPKSATPDRPGNFVNLQDYLNANKPQAEKLGNQASGVIQNSADNARQSVTGLQNDANQAIQPTANLSDDVKSKINNNAETLSNEERQNIKNTQTATYKGPQTYADLSSYQKASDATQKGIQNVANAGTEQGRMDLISQINSKPRTQGQNVFDNALLQAGSGRQKIQDAAAANQNLKSNLDSATQGIQSQIGRADDPSTPDIDESAGAIGQTNKAQADAAKTVQDALNAWKTGFNPKVAQAQQNLVDLQNAMTQDIADNPNKLSEQDLALLGLNRGTRRYNVDLNQFLHQASPSDINAANVASPEDYARYAALADLAGDQSNLLDPANASKAGTAPTLGVDKQGLADALAAAQTKYDQDYATVGSLTPFINNVGGNGGNYQYIGSQYTPDYIENELIPQLSAPHEYDEAVGDTQTSQANELKAALERWRANQGFNNIVNGYGANGDMTGEDGSIYFPGGIHKNNRG